MQSIPVSFNGYGSVNVSKENNWINKNINKNIFPVFLIADSEGTTVRKQ